MWNPSRFCISLSNYCKILYFEMNSISRFIFFIAIFCSFHTLEASLKTGLVFSTKFERLDERSITDGDKECHSCLVACPASAYDKSEKLINKHASVTKNSVFARKYYDGRKTAINVISDRCDKSFRGPTIVHDKKNKTYEVGYELYYREGGLKNDMECTRFDNFKEITEGYVKNLKHLGITIAALQKNSITKDGYDDVEIKRNIGTKFEYPNEQSFIFYWISVLSFRFHPAENQISVYLNADIVNNYNSDMKCDNYELGNDLYKSEEKFYPFSKEVRGSIVNTPLAPLQYLHTKAGKLAGCTKLNSIPVWNNVAERLNLIDLYLYALYRIKSINPRINMFFGVSGIQTIEKVSIDDGNDNNGIGQTEEGHELIEKENESFEEKNILMPKILYRMVEYADITIDDKGLKSVMNKYILVIIHNERNGVSKKDRLCGENQVFDLEVMWNEKKEKEIFSYACALDSPMLKDLGVYDDGPLTESHSTLIIKEQFGLKFTNNVKEPIVKIEEDPKENIEGGKQP